eukprot:CAMPEP_0194234792 /NCGR_PEP_ID=MMETSP0158-20130606/2429_1 /TAXON_ID=33649 /ORGANISM="Thalassionema nitzschioides, Strain L26-B" /LENGTH=631 /DNA_ID=CAMNT_0038968073 /DNA_START=74 /DNA_END=1969 /DNA_ORIENTATION=+
MMNAAAVFLLGITVAHCVQLQDPCQDEYNDFDICCFSPPIPLSLEGETLGDGNNRYLQGDDDIVCVYRNVRLCETVQDLCQDCFDEALNAERCSREYDSSLNCELPEDADACADFGCKAESEAEQQCLEDSSCVEFRFDIPPPKNRESTFGVDGGNRYLEHDCFSENVSFCERVERCQACFNESLEAEHCNRELYYSSNCELPEDADACADFERPCKAESEAADRCFSECFESPNIDPPTQMASGVNGDRRNLQDLCYSLNTLFCSNIETCPGCSDVFRAKEACEREEDLSIGDCPIPTDATSCASSTCEAETEALNLCSMENSCNSLNHRQLPHLVGQELDFLFCTFFAFEKCESIKQCPACEVEIRAAAQCESGCKVPETEFCNCEAQTNSYVWCVSLECIPSDVDQPWPHSETVCDQLCAETRACSVCQSDISNYWSCLYPDEACELDACNVDGTTDPCAVVLCEENHVCDVDGVGNVACVLPPLACTEDALNCPDGSAVGRDPYNNCEFYPCGPDKSCVDVECEGSDICILREVECVDAPCNPVPTCVQNPCATIDCQDGYSCEVEFIDGTGDCVAVGQPFDPTADEESAPTVAPVASGLSTKGKKTSKGKKESKEKKKSEDSFFSN